MLCVNAHQIPYTLLRKHVKNINIRITPQDGVVVSANDYVSIEKIEEVLRNKISFVLRNLQRCARIEQRPMFPEKIENGQEMRLLGVYYPIAVVEACWEGVRFDGTRVIVNIKKDAAQERRLYILEKWLRGKAQEMFAQVAQRVYEEFRASYRIVYPQIRVRKMRSRWGSAMPKKGMITLNLMLVHYPAELIEYVVVHEFAHLIQPNHSEKFYAVVAHFVPDYKEKRRKLNSM